MQVRNLLLCVLIWDTVQLGTLAIQLQSWPNGETRAMEPVPLLSHVSLPLVKESWLSPLCEPWPTESEMKHSLPSSHGAKDAAFTGFPSQLVWENDPHPGIIRLSAFKPPPHTREGWKHPQVTPQFPSMLWAYC